MTAVFIAQEDIPLEQLFNLLSYKPRLDNKDIVRFLNIPRQKNATIGDISIIPTGGINLLKGPRKISLKFLRLLKGSLYQLIFGNHDNRIVINKSRNIKSNILATAIVIPI